MKLSIATQTICVKDVKLAYYISEKQYDKTIILLHGYCGSSAYYYKLVPLLEKFATVVVFDLFGHGNSSPLPQEKYALDEIASLLHEAFKQLELSNVYLFGHSLGGYITLAYAKQFEANLKGYGLLHSTAFPDSDAAKANRLNVIQAVKTEGVATFASQLVAKLFGENPQDEDVELTTQIGLTTTVAGVVGFAHAMREREDRQTVIANAEVPVLLIAGKEDKIVAPEAVFAGHSAQTSCHCLEHAGHMGMLEEEQQMADVIRDFVHN